MFESDIKLRGPQSEESGKDLIEKRRGFISVPNRDRLVETTSYDKHPVRCSGV